MALIDSVSNLFVLGAIPSGVNYYASEGTLPKAQGWARKTDGSPPEPSVVAGILHVGPTSPASENIDWRALNFDQLDFTTDNFYFEVQLKIINSSRTLIDVPQSWRDGFEMLVADKNGRGFIFGVSDSLLDFTHDLGAPNSSSELTNSITPVAFDSTDGFHLYALRIRDGSGTLTVDGSGVGVLAVSNIYSIPASRFLWGENSIFAIGEWEIQWIETSAIQATINISTSLVIVGSATEQNDLNLYTKSSEQFSASGNLTIQGLDVLDASGALLTQGSTTSSGNATLVINGFISSLSSPIGSVEGRFVDNVDITNDFTPSLIGQFISTSPSSVTIKVWDIIDGANVVLILLDDTAQQIGDTESWFWSMSNMPFGSKADGNFLFRMTADTGETIEKEVNIRTISDGNWKHP